MAVHYVLADDAIEQLNENFYRLYDADHWFYKIKTYDILLDSTEKFVEELGDEELQKKSIEEFQRAVETEVVGTFYHITESLFMLMASCSTDIPWLTIRGIKVNGPQGIKTFLEEEILDEQLSDENIKATFYSGFQPPDGQEETLKESIEFIREYLSRMGEKYKETEREIYNEYKHGLRLATTNSRMSIHPEEELGGKAGPPVVQRGGTAHVYLQRERIKKEGSEDFFQVHQVTRGFDYELFLKFCYINHLLIDQLIRVRRARNNSSDGMVVNSFHDFEIEEIFDYDISKEWKFSRTYPTGNRVYTIK